VPAIVPAIVLATRNRGKIAELSGMLADTAANSGLGGEIQVLGLDAFPEIGEIPEEGDSFEENALYKACQVSKATGLVAVADDSGLEVDALDGRPGVYSARYSADDPAAAGLQGAERDAANNEKLLRELLGVAEQKRTARFRCVMAACSPEGETLVRHGAWEGRIALAPEGDKGFGYDPVFIDPDSGTTAACLDPAQKNARSHRGKALRALLDAWPGFWEQAARGV